MATSSISEQALSAAQEATDRVQEQAHEIADQTQGVVREQLEMRSKQLASEIQQQAADLHSVSVALREQGKDGPAHAADWVAGYAEKAGGYLQGREVDVLIQDAEDFGRKRPAVVALGALGLGFAASRFLKASSSRRYAARDGARHAAPVHNGHVPHEPSPVVNSGAESTASPTV